MTRFNFRKLNVSALAFAAVMALGMAQSHAAGVSGGLNVSAGTIAGNSAIQGTSQSTAVSNLSGTGKSTFSTANQTGGSTFVGGSLAAGGLTTIGQQSTYSNVQTSGKISGGAQPFDSEGLTSNGAGSFGSTNTAIAVSGTFAKFGATGNAYVNGFKK